VKNVSNNEEGLAFFEEHEKPVAKGVLFKGARTLS
jgi:hypothetical protein